MATLTNDALFKVTFVLNNSPKDFTWQDQTTYNYHGIAVGDARIKLKITDPNGDIVYVNADWNDDLDFTGSDLNGAATLTGACDVPLDSSSKPLLGTYTFECIIGDTTGSGDCYHTSWQYDYEYESPEVVIEQSMDYRTSELTSTDATVLAVNGTSPTTSTLAHYIYKPADAAGCAIPPAPYWTTDITRTIGGGATQDLWIWTGDWRTYISNVLLYDITTRISVNDTIVGSDSISVTGSAPYLNYKTGYNNIFNRFVTALSSNRNEAANLATVLIELNTLYELYEQYERDGESTDTYLTQIYNLIRANTSYTYSESDVSEPVVPWGAPLGGSGSTIVPIGTGTAAPTSTSYDYYFLADRSVFQWWVRIGGVWTMVQDLTPVAGAAGENGSNLLYHLWHDDVTIEPCPGETILKTFTVPANTIALNEILYVEIALLCTGDPERITATDYWFIRLNGVSIAGAAGRVVLPNKIYQEITMFKCWITRTGAATATVLYDVRSQNLGNVIDSYFRTIALLNWAADQTLTFSYDGNNIDDDYIAKYMTVIHYKTS